MSEGRGLADIHADDLERALRLVEAGRLSCPLSEAGLQAQSFGGRIPALLSLFGGVDRAGVLATLRAVLAEREHRPPPRLEHVWTGPELANATSRDTAVVVRQLFAGARESVLLAGYSFDHGQDLLVPLHEAMTRGVKVTVFMDIPGEVSDDAGVDAYATQKIDEFFRDNWPWQPRPDVYFDPRTAKKGPPWVSLHAKVVVVDNRFTFTGSANFTQRGQERNIESGVSIDDRAFAETVVRQWMGLIGAGLVRRYHG